MNAISSSQTFSVLVFSECIDFWGKIVEEAVDSPVEVIRFVCDKQVLAEVDVIVVDGSSNPHFYGSILPDLDPSLPVMVVTPSCNWETRLALSKMQFVTVLPPRQVDTVAQSLAVIERIRAIPSLAVLTTRASVMTGLQAPNSPNTRIYKSERSLWKSLQREIPDAFVIDFDSSQSGECLARSVRQDFRTCRSLVVAICSPVEITDSTLFDDIFDERVASFDQISASIRARFRRNYAVRKLIETDPMTGLGNRRRAELRVQLFIRLANRQRVPLALGILDLDRFKSINDTYGHAIGDRVIKRLGRTLRQFFRAEDVAARIGGEEFLVCMYGVNAETLAARLRALLQKFSSHRFQTDDESKFQVSFSAGVSQLSQEALDYQTLSELADQALYRAKEQGRNQVAVYGENQLARPCSQV